MSSLQRNQDMLNYAAQQASVNAPELFNTDCSMMPVIAYLKDHKAQTLDDVVAIADRFARENSSPDRQFLLAAGSAGIEAATNIVVREANRTMLLFVYLAVTLFCLITFRSWRATLVALLPLVLTSVLCEALMVAMGIGVKVATLPVIALASASAWTTRCTCSVCSCTTSGRAAPWARRTRTPWPSPAGWSGWWVSPCCRRGRLGVVANQVPGRHGHPADLHVPLEHARRTAADPGPVALPAAGQALCRGGPRALRSRTTAP